MSRTKCTYRQSFIYYNYILLLLLLLLLSPTCIGLFWAIIRDKTHKRAIQNICTYCHYTMQIMQAKNVVASSIHTVSVLVTTWRIKIIIQKCVQYGHTKWQCNKKFSLRHVLNFFHPIVWIQSGWGWLWCKLSKWTHLMSVQYEELNKMAWNWKRKSCVRKNSARFEILIAMFLKI
jgi:hypothetical protein